MDQNASNSPNDNHGDDNGERRVFTETFVFTGTGQSFLATMQNLMNRIVSGPQAQQQPQQQPAQQPDQPQEDSLVPSNMDSAVPEGGQVPPPSLLASSPGGGDLDSARDPTHGPRLSTHGISIDQAQDVDTQLPPQQPMMDAVDLDEEMPDLDSMSESDDEPPSMPTPRPIRPLPRNGVSPGPQPHAHFHVHTPNGTIDLFTFSVPPGDAIPPPQPGAGPSFTFNLGSLPGQDVLAGFEAFFLGMPSMEKEREPDIERAKVLLRGMEVVPEGLVRRLERAGGVPGGHGTEESGSAAGCAVCWGPLLDEVEPGEWETALPAKEKQEMPDTDEKDKDKGKVEEQDEMQGRIVALPCAHVYHAECLLPWFSRQTTCPTCRLDVDAESLTWTPRPPRVPPPPPPAQPNPTSEQPSPPDANNAPQPQPSMPNPHDPNAAEAVRLDRFFNSQPFLFWPTRGGDQPSQPTNNTPMFGPPPPPLQQQQQHIPRHVFAHAGLHQFNLPFPIPPPAQPNPFPLNNLPPPNNPIDPRPRSNSVPSSLNVPPPPSPRANPAPPPAPEAPQQRNFMTLPPLPMFVVHPGTPPHTHPQPPHPHPHPHPPIHTHGPAPPRRERRKWTPPEPVGKTLRQRVEQKERELGLRCDDVVCGVGPTDEEPVPRTDAATTRIQIHAAYDAQGKACEHSFHPACLVMSARVAGVTGEEEEVQVACPSCRAEGSLSHAEWTEGVRASQAEMA